MTQTINKYADTMLNKISQCIAEETKNLPTLSGAKVSSVNTDGTINVYFPPDDTKIFTNISNQTPFNLQVGDSVELLLKDGSYNNCWIVAKHQDTFTGKFSNSEDIENLVSTTEIDPVFASSPAYLITEADISKWDSATSVFPSSTVPKMDGTATVGTETSYARGDHIHPTDTTRQTKITASGILKGDGNGAVTSAVAGTDYAAASHTHNASAIVSGTLDWDVLPTARIYDATASRTANTVLAAPNGSAGPASFRALVAADVPAVNSLTNFSSRVYDATASRTKNTVLAAPNGSNGAASFRALVEADIPTLTKSKISDFPTSMTPTAHNHAAGDINSGTLGVARGGTGAASFTANCVVMSGSSTTAALTTRAVTNNTATSTAVTASTNIPTMNTLRYAINRTTSVAAADTGYTTLMARGMGLRNADTNPGVNGAINWTYE